MIKFTKYGLAIAAFATMCLATSASAAVNLAVDNSNPQTTTALTGISTFSDDMAGMKVTAWFSDGSTETATWVMLELGRLAPAGHYRSPETPLGATGRWKIISTLA